MIAWLRGTIVNIDGNEVILNTNNVGYQVFIESNLIQRRGIKVGETNEFVVYTAVREDEIKLFGFDTFFDRKIFTMLLGVNGVGPKVAAKIVDQLTSTQVILAIKNNECYPLTEVPGVGKKTAQRIILDLQEKIENLGKWGENIEQVLHDKIDLQENKNQIEIKNDARSALANLGFSDKEVERVIRKYIKQGATLDGILRKCLAELTQN